MDCADQLLSESRNNVYHNSEYIRKMKCPGRFDDEDPCSAGEKKVNMAVREDGIWTTIICPICGYKDFWSVGDGDELF